MCLSSYDRVHLYAKKELVLRRRWPISKLSFFQGLNQDSEEDDDSDAEEEEDDDEEDEREEEKLTSRKSSEKDVNMDGPTRDELEQTAEGQFNLSEDEDAETGTVKFFY